jgi:hypothetical protein
MSDIFETKVRQYTDVERKAMEFEPGGTPAEKAARYINTHFIDVERFREAIVEHPDLNDHFSRLIEASGTFYEGVLGFMINDGKIDPADYPEINLSVPVAYGGTESDVRVTLGQPLPQNYAAMRWELPA